MSVNWNWSDKCGEITLVQMHPGEEDNEFTITLYNGNCFLVMLHEFKDAETGEDMYDFFGFFSDKEHAKNCLGLNKKKGYDNNIYCTPYQKFTKLRVNKKKCRYTKDMVTLFAEAFDDITIEVYSEEEGVK